VAIAEGIRGLQIPQLKNNDQRES
jgi:hypothetical protein